MPALLAPLAEWLSTVLWPALVRLTVWLGLGKLITLIVDYLKLMFAEKIMQTLIAGSLVFALLTAWGVFLLVVWNWSSYAVIKEAFSANPFQDVNYMAGALYLASHAFPFRFFFGTAIAFLQWRLTVIHAAIIFNRLVRLMIGT